MGLPAKQMLVDPDLRRDTIAIAVASRCIYN
jgi:hypothetical protein